MYDTMGVTDEDEMSGGGGGVDIAATLPTLHILLCIFLPSSLSSALWAVWLYYCVATRARAERYIICHI